MALFPESVDLATLVLRVFLGAIFIIHGFPKLFRAEARAQTIGFMKSVGIPPALTLAASLLEFFGGLGLLVGLLTQVAALLLALELVGTTIPPPGAGARGPAGPAPLAPRWGAGTRAPAALARRRGGLRDRLRRDRRRAA